jgi:hypothetical protein
MIGGGRWRTLLTLLFSWLHTNTSADWRPSWREFGAPWWQSAFIQTAIIMVARSISRMGISWLFSAPMALLGDAANAVFMWCLESNWSPLFWVLFAVYLFAVAASACLDLVCIFFTTGPMGFVAGPGSVLPVLFRPVWAVGRIPLRWLTKCFLWCSNLVLPVRFLHIEAEMFCLSDSSVTKGICSTLHKMADAKEAAHAAAAAAPAVYPHSWWFDLLLVIWLFYVISVITKWEELYGKAYYRWV